VALRFEGQRRGYHWDPQSTSVDEATLTPYAFRERWTLQATGIPEESPGPTCEACGAPSPLTATACPYCGAPASYAIGPWLLIDLRSERPTQQAPKSPSPFEGYGGQSNVR